MFPKRARRAPGVGAGVGDFYGVDDDVPHNGPKPTLQSSVVMPAIETKSRDAAISELKSTEKVEQKSRNQRMFANLLVGTLNKFRKDERKISTVEKVQMQKQKEIEQRLEEKKKTERETVMKERGELMEQRRDKEREIRKLQRKRAIVQYAEREQDHTRKLQNFIQTVAKPPIFYLPGKHTLRTLELLKNTAKRLEEQVTKRQEQLEKDLAAVDTAPI
uniref:Pinin/SDK/MemA protein domain-containing protein n=1 Tax=Plectus sambesii TaxID=2011161 RepID=A0A914UIW5_9BILA